MIVTDVKTKSRARTEPTVYVVEDDQAVRDSLCWLISTMDLPVLAFASASEFLETVQPGHPGCAIIDVRLPGMNGLELQEELNERSPDLPVIVITGHGTEKTASRAMAAGALGYLEKPTDDEALMELVKKGIEKSVAKLV